MNKILPQHKATRRKTVNTPQSISSAQPPCSIKVNYIGHVWNGDQFYYIHTPGGRVRMHVENEDVVGAAPTGDAPATSEWSNELFRECNTMADILQTTF